MFEQSVHNCEDLCWVVWPYTSFTFTLENLCQNNYFYDLKFVAEILCNTWHSRISSQPHTLTVHTVISHLLQVLKNNKEM